MIPASLSLFAYCIALVGAMRGRQRILMAAGAVAVLYGIVVATISRNMGVWDFLRFILTSTKLTASALVVLAGAALVIAGNVLVVWREHQLGLERARARAVTDPKA